jgi:hypothetical protein
MRVHPRPRVGQSPATAASPPLATLAASPSFVQWRRRRKRRVWKSRARTRAEVGASDTAHHHLIMGRPGAIEGVLSFPERALAVPWDWPEEA